MHIKKAIIAGFIFILLFGGAWWVHEEVDRFGDMMNTPQKQQILPGKQMNTDRISIQEVHDNGTEEQTEETFQRYKPFKPREYIRIRQVTPE